MGDALFNLSSVLKGFPALLLGIAGAGAAYIAFLKSVSAEADKATASIEKNSKAIQNSFMEANLKIGAIQAGSRGDLAGQKVGEFGLFKRQTENARDEALKAAERERAGAIGVMDLLLPPADLIRKSQMADEELATKRRAINQKANDDIRVAREQLAADLVKIEEDLDKKLADFQEKRVEDAEKAAEKQKQLIADLLSPQNMKFLEQFGKEFEDLNKQLDLEANVAKAREAITQLEAAIAAGMDKNGLYAKGVTTLKEKIEEATKQGFWPAVKAVEAVAKAEEQAAFNAEEWHKRIEEMIPGIDALIAKGAALQASQAAGAAGAPPTTASGPAAVSGATSGYGYATYGTVETAGPNMSGGSGFGSAGGQISTLPDDMPSFQHGGIVPGVGPVPIIAHGGERVLPVGASGSGGARMVRIERGAIQISGTLIDQSRSWGVLVEELGQALAARMR